MRIFHTANQHIAHTLAGCANDDERCIDASVKRTCMDERSAVSIQ
jgi:hypothetical protein